MLTKLKKVLLEEDIEQKTLYKVIEDNELQKDEPSAPVYEPTISIYARGKMKNPQMATMQKILDGINTIVKSQGKDKLYTLSDIF